MMNPVLLECKDVSRTHMLFRTSYAEGEGREVVMCGSRHSSSIGVRAEAESLVERISVLEGFWCTCLVN
jgi:hypothetical protein